MLQQRFCIPDAIHCRAALKHKRGATHIPRMSTYRHRVKHIQRARQWLNGRYDEIRIPRSWTMLPGILLTLSPYVLAVHPDGDEHARRRRLIVAFALAISFVVVVCIQGYVHVKLDKSYDKMSQFFSRSTYTPGTCLAFDWNTWIDMHHRRARAWRTAIQRCLDILWVNIALTFALFWWSLVDVMMREDDDDQPTDHDAHYHNDGVEYMVLFSILVVTSRWIVPTLLENDFLQAALEARHADDMETLSYIQQLQRVRPLMAPWLPHCTFLDALQHLVAQEEDLFGSLEDWQRLATSSVSAEQLAWSDTLRYLQIMCIRTPILEAAQYVVKKRSDTSVSTTGHTEPSVSWVVHAVEDDTPHDDDVLITMPRILL
jgi:hypothetical protein